MTMTTLGDLLARADDLCHELRDSQAPVPLTAWESFDATAYLLMRELVGPARTGNRAFVLSQAALSRVLDAYPAPLRSAATGPVGAREAAHLLGRPRSAVIAKIRNGQIPAAWDGRQYLVDVTDLPSRDDVRPANPVDPEPLPRLSCTLGAAADLIAQNCDPWTRHVDVGVESLDAVSGPIVAHVLGIVHVAASHAVRVGPLSDVDRPLSVARYSVTALDTLGEVRRDSPMLATASFAPPLNPMSLNERLESGLRLWVAAAQAELNRTVPSTDVIRNVMNQGVHLYAVSARLIEATDLAVEPSGGNATGARESLHVAMKELSQADRLWGSVTTAMPPSHGYVAAARELNVALTDTTHDGLRARDANEIAKNLDIGQAIEDLRCATHDVADLARDVQHLPDQLLRSGLLFAPASKLKPSIERLHDRSAGRYVSVLPDEFPALVTAARTAATGSDTAARALDRHVSQALQFTVEGTNAKTIALVPEL
jgi:hypothetical protein